MVAAGLALAAAGLLVTADLADAQTSGPPEITMAEELNVEVGQTIALEATATDPDGGDISWSIEFVNPDEFGDATLFTADNSDAIANEAGLDAIVVGEILGDVNGNDFTAVILEATDDQGESSTARADLFIGSDADIVEFSPDETLEDEPVTLNVSAERRGTSVSDVEIVKNYIWQDEPLLDKAGATNVGGTFWEQTYTYGLPDTHFPGYRVIGADGTSAVLVEPLEVLEAGPEILMPGGMAADNAQAVAIIAEGSDSDGEAFTWEFSTSPAVDGDRVIDQGERQIWVWLVPDDFDQNVVVSATATDTKGVSTTESTTLFVRDDRLVDPALPEEEATGITAKNPIIGLDVFLSAEIDPVTTLLGVDLDWPAGIDSLTATTENDDGLQQLETVFTEEGPTQVGWLLEANNGGKAAILQQVLPESNDAPIVDAGTDQAADGSIDAELRAHAIDPEGRALSQDSYEWFLVSSPLLDPGESERKIATGAHSHFSTDVSGTHKIELRVTDPYGLTGTDTLKAQVDDLVSLEAELINAHGQTSDGVYIVNPLKHDLDERIKGVLSVKDDTGSPVNGEIVTGTVTYYGLRANGDGLQTAEVNVTTNTSGEAMFTFDKELLGATGRGESLLSGPGYHEIVLTVETPSRLNAPIQDLETDSVTIPYWVGLGLGPLT